MIKELLPWFIGGFTLTFVAIAGAYLYGYHIGYEHGLVKYGWCGSCQSYHGNDEKCQELPENA